MKLTLHPFELPLKYPFGISRGTISVRHTLIVELEQDGVSGYGEATENAYYGVTVDDMRLLLDQVRPIVEAAVLGDPAEFWQQMQVHLARCPFAHCALDTAAHDLWGKLQNEPVWKLWGLSLENLPSSNYTIGLDTIEVMIHKLEEFPGWPVYKIKLGTKSDVEIVRRLRERTEATFRVDANGAWNADQTVQIARALAPLGVEFLEQPLPADDWRGVRRAARESVLPIVADESCRLPGDVDRVSGLFQGINIKLVKCGGLTPARRMIARARQLGLEVMVGCMTESTVGISAIAQLLPLVDYADLDGALLLSRDIATGVRLERGRVIYSRDSGCGVRLL